MSTLAKACDEDLGHWASLLPLALLADWITCSSIIGYMLAKLMTGHFPLMLLEKDVCSWRLIGWRDEVTRDELLARRIEHFGLLPAKIEVAQR